MSQKGRPRRRLVRRRRVRKDGPAPLRIAVRGALAVLAAALLFVLWTVWAYGGPGPRAETGSMTTVVLERGEGVAQIARSLKRSGVIRSPRLFILAAKTTGAARSLKAGEYEIASGASMAKILADIRDGKVVRHFVAVPEGWTSGMATDAVNRQPVLTGMVLTPPPEGSLLPDTYLVQRGQSREAVIARMRKARDTLLADLWAKRQAGLPFNMPEEAVTLASIVEKETALPVERPRIAAVYINRLRLGMRLESDPTIIYGITRGRPLGRGITASELADPTPYNTYRVGGLPPTPIANPGRDSLAAVLNPPTTDEIFFVANGSGGHSFSKTYEEHEKNVAHWRTVERAAKAGAK